MRTATFRFSESGGSVPEPLHRIAFPVEILTKPSFTEKPFFSLKTLAEVSAPKKIFNPPTPPENSPIRCGHPPGPSAPPVLETPPTLSIKNRPPPLPRRVGPPIPFPEQKKKISETSAKKLLRRIPFQKIQNCNVEGRRTLPWRPRRPWRPWRPASGVPGLASLASRAPCGAIPKNQGWDLLVG